MVNPNPQVEANSVQQCRDMASIFRIWDEQHSQAGYDPVPVLTRISELIEEESEIYNRKDPDPFDERHPSRTDPNCELGRMLKLLFRKDNFMARLVNDYLRDNFFTRQNLSKSSLELNIAASRLILVIMPGLETSAVFQTQFDTLINKLYSWAETSVDPLQSYATGLLAAAMEVQDIASNFREQNIRLVPLMLKRLREIQAGNVSTESNATGEGCSSGIQQNLNMDVVPDDSANLAGGEAVSVSSRPFAHLNSNQSKIIPETLINGKTTTSNDSEISTVLNEQSQNTNESKSIRYVRNSIPIHPATSATSQMLILRYLASMGEYQEFLGQVFEFNAMEIIFKYIENIDPKDTCLAFESLKYLASLMCHKKFALEFISHGGLERLLKVPKPSVASTGVSIALYYLAYCEDAMEQICTMSQRFITELVNYALWLLGCSHDSGKCHATMFFGLSFQFKVILDEFDKQDGLRKLYNVVSVLDILSVDDYDLPLNDDEQCAARQIVRLVCVTLKKYMESHLYYKYTQVTRQQNPVTIPAPPMFRAPKNTPEVISDQVRTLQEILPIRANWSPVNQLLELGGITLLLRVVTYSYEWNYSGRAETVRSALEVLAICCVIPQIHSTFCESIELPDESFAAGINIILGAAEGEIVIDAEVQKSALNVLINCVCSPLYRPISVSRFGSAKKKVNSKYSDELIQKVWDSVRSNNGIIVLLQLMQIKTPITDADCIRGMACRALAGLARSETVKQIISKLPLFTSGQLQLLTRDPILQEKRSEHVQFQKYALELIERVSGKIKASNQVDATLVNIHRANVVAQTRIQYNEQQLYQLMHDHLVSKGLLETANSLQREAGLSSTSCTIRQTFPSPFNYRNPTTTLVARNRLRARAIDFNGSSSSLELNGESDKGSALGQQVTPMDTDELNSSGTSAVNTPIRLIRKNLPQPSSSTSLSNTTPQNQRSLQKQIMYTDDFALSIQKANATAIEPQTVQKNITLDSIVTEYLTNQHALCKNPMSTCPQFDLFMPHKCPDPRPNRRSGLSFNFAGRLYRRELGYGSRRLDRHLINSRFSMIRMLRSKDPDQVISVCDFMPCGKRIVAGTDSGDVGVFNLDDQNDEFYHQCHETVINNLRCSRDGRFILTSATWRTPLSALWTIEDREIDIRHTYDEEEYMEFSNLSDDKVLGTKSSVATIFDVETGNDIATFNPTISNQYTKNRATFCPTDDLILCDGVLWDVRTEKKIHKFDKLNQTLSGVFHPNGLEIISNSEVWDLRTFHLMRTVPALDQCQIAFSPLDVIYSIGIESDHAEFEHKRSTESSFQTLDSYDYSSIATVDVQKNIYDLRINKYGSHIAVVENQGGYESMRESVIRIYSVGRKRNKDEMEEEGDETENSDDDDGSILYLSDENVNDDDEWAPDDGDGADADGDGEMEVIEDTSSSSDSSSDDSSVHDDDDDDDNSWTSTSDAEGVAII